MENKIIKLNGKYLRRVHSNNGEWYMWTKIKQYSTKFPDNQIDKIKRIFPDATVETDNSRRLYGNTN
mgnify:CR=1 FL=1